MFFADLNFPEAYMMIAYIAAFVFAGLLLVFLIIAKNPVWSNKVLHKLLHIFGKNKSRISFRNIKEKSTCIWENSM